MGGRDKRCSQGDIKGASLGWRLEQRSEGSIAVVVARKMETFYQDDFSRLDGRVHLAIQQRSTCSGQQTVSRNEKVREE